jgi:hypothetical protein
MSLNDFNFPMIELVFPAGQVIGFQKTTYRDSVIGIDFSPKEIGLWIFCFTYRCTWYGSNVIGQNAIRINNETIWRVK